MLFSPRAGLGDGCITAGVALAASALGLLVLLPAELLTQWLQWQLAGGLALALLGRWLLARARLPH